MSEYYGVQRSTSLSHYGVKGMKWGVRKQNRDGSLTVRGMRKVARMNTSYLNPKRSHRGKKKAINRDAISKQYTDEWTKFVKKKGIKEEDISVDMDAPKGVERIWNKYKDPYAGAVLKDAKLRDTKQGRASVKKFFKQTDPDYDDNTSKYKPDYSNFDQVRAKYADRKYQIAHPVLHKMKKQTKGLKQDLKDATKTAALSLVMGGPGAAMYMSSRKAVRDSSGCSGKKKKRK